MTVYRPLTDRRLQSASNESRTSARTSAVQPLPSRRISPPRREGREEGSEIGDSRWWIEDILTDRRLQSASLGINPTQAPKSIPTGSDILIRSENDLPQFAATATSMKGAFFLVSGLWSLASWPDGAKPYSDPQTQRTGNQGPGSGSLRYGFTPAPSPVSLPLKPQPAHAHESRRRCVVGHRHPGRRPGRSAYKHFRSPNRTPFDRLRGVGTADR